jgi:N-dimethylarginine dimethylaminohydrolase
VIARDIKNSALPAYLMNVPFSMETDEPNNAIMMNLTAEERVVDRRKAMEQWLELYHFLSSRGIVYLVPSKEGLQDQPYVANLGIVLPHVEENLAAISNFRTEVRRGETPVGVEFFRSMGFDTVIAPEFFEGEADLKYLRDNIYIGAHGMRTSMSALEWFRDAYGMRIIPLRMQDEYLFHLDCVVFPLTGEKVVLCTAVCDKRTVAEIESVAEIIDIDHDLARAGLTNAVRCGHYVLCDSSVDKMDLPAEMYALERKKVEGLARICVGNGLAPAIFDLSEFDKSGAALSCLVMHLNFASYR